MKKSAFENLIFWGVCGKHTLLVRKGLTLLLLGWAVIDPVDQKQSGISSILKLVSQNKSLFSSSEAKPKDFLRPVACHEK